MGDSVEEALTTIRRSGRFALDLETTGLNPRTARILSANIACADKEWGLMFVGKDALPYAETMERLRPVLADEKLLSIYHNGKYDLECLTVAGVEVKTQIADTMIAAYLLDESLAGTTGLSLASLALVELGVELKPYKAFSQEGDLNLGGPGIEEKGVQDARATLDLWKKFETRLKKDDRLWKCYWDLAMPIVRVLVEMELAGVVVDIDWMMELKKRLLAEAQGYEKEIFKLVGRQFNIGSTEQLSAILFGELGLKPKSFMVRFPKKNQLKKTGADGQPLWSTKEEVLSEYAAEHKVAELVMDFRHATKLVSTNVEPFIEEAAADPEHRLRTHYWQTGTESGRLSSSDPVNMQNLPRDKGMIRKGIVAPAGGVLIAADYNQLELRLMAHQSRDPLLMQAYLDGVDIHQQTMDRLGIKERVPAKNVNFGVIYDIHAPTLQKTLWVKARVRVTLADCERWIIRFFETYQGVKKYHGRIAAEIRENGYVKSIVGRYRRVKKLLAQEAQGLGAPGYAFRVAVNFTIQGSGADLTFIAMRNLQRAIVAHRATNPLWTRVRMLAQVHDSLLIESPKEIAEEVLALVKHIMETAIALPSGVPIVANVGMGHSWEDAEDDAKTREKAEAKKVPA